MAYDASLIIAITQAKSEPWESIWLNGQLPTWVGRFKDEVEIVNASGLSMGNIWKRFDSFHERNRYSKRFGLWQGRFDYLFVPWLARNIPSSKTLEPGVLREIQILTNSSYIFSGRRLIGLINWFVKETSYEFLFITTTSSFINVNQLCRHVSGFDRDVPIYAGHVLGESPEKFVTGAGQLINRKTAEIVVSNFRQYPHRMLNDVALGSLLLKNGVKPIEVPWTWCKSVDEVLELSEENLSLTMHFRCKTSSNPRTDSEVMTALHQRLTALSIAGIGEY
jgi:hypothetical protein